VVICVAAIAGTIIYFNRQKPMPPPVPVVEASLPSAEPATPEKIVAPKPDPRRIVSDTAGEPKPAAASSPVASDLQADGVATALSQAVDILISPQASFQTRRELWQKLKEAGQLDQVIAELKRRAANNPNDPAIPTALGVGLMNKFPVQDFNEAALLGLQIDQNFNTALKLDPANWEAQYEKAGSMSYWPDVAGDKKPEIIQRLSSLIDQQETMPPQPQFAKTYILLGDQYKKAGQADLAQATWQLGAQKFPNNSTLQKKIASP
jgi:tetratricopeptide (TPR) repeat protein